jgi:hypothetical protein
MNVEASASLSDDVEAETRRGRVGQSGTYTASLHDAYSLPNARVWWGVPRRTWTLDMDALLSRLFDCIHARARGQLIDIISQHNICNPAGSDPRIPAWGTLEYHLALTLLLETLSCLYSAFSYLIAIMRIPQYSSLF